MTIKEQVKYCSYYLANLSNAGLEDSWQYKFIEQFMEESYTFKDRVAFRIADFLWWMSMSDYSWKAKLFYPLYQDFCDKYIFNQQSND